MSNLAGFVDDIARARVRVVDLTRTLSPDFPTLVLPPQFRAMRAICDQRDLALRRTRRRRSGTGTTSVAASTPERISMRRSDWVTGRDRAHNSVDTIDPRDFIAGACVIDCSREAAANEDFVLTGAADRSVGK